MFLSSLSCCWQCSGILWSCQNYIFFLLFTNSQYKPFEGANKENSSNKRNIKDVQQQCPPTPSTTWLCSPLKAVLDPQKLNYTYNHKHTTLTSMNYLPNKIYGWMLCLHFLEIASMIDDFKLKILFIWRLQIEVVFDILAFQIYWEISHKSANFHIFWLCKNMTTHSPRIIPSPV